MNGEAPIDASRLLRQRRASLEALTAPGVLFQRENQLFRCTACAHRCVLGEGRAGVCGVRVRRGDELRVPYGYVARTYVRPVETNTIFHVRPGSLALSFGMYGCDLRCPYCHNWRLSQAHRDVEAGGPTTPTSAAGVVDLAESAGCQVLCAAYNEPMISAEWTRAVFEEAKARGLVTALVTDGHTTPEALSYLRPVTDVLRVDLKGHDDAQYRRIGGKLKPVLESIELGKRLGLWVEVVTLVVPSLNDDPRGMRRLTDFLVGLDASIPWHLNAFQPRYRMKDRLPPAQAELWNYAATACARGMSFVYVGNVVDPTFMGTRCPACRSLVVERHDWQATKVAVVDGACPSCKVALPGLW
jgi:pyruvate formate lyase activating enzyme